MLLLPNVHHVFPPFMVWYYHCPYIVLLVGVSLEAKTIVKCLQLQQNFTQGIYICIFPRLCDYCLVWVFFSYIEDDMLIIWLNLIMHK